MQAETITTEYKTLQQILREAEETRRKSLQIEEKLKRVIVHKNLKKSDFVEFSKKGDEIVDVRIPKLERMKTMILDEKKDVKKARPRTDSKLPRPKPLNYVKSNVKSVASQGLKKGQGGGGGGGGGGLGKGVAPNPYAAKKKVLSKVESGLKGKKGGKKKIAEKEEEVKVEVPAVQSRPSTEEMLRESQELIRSIGRRDGGGLDLGKIMEKMSLTNFKK